MTRFLLLTVAAGIVITAGLGSQLLPPTNNGIAKWLNEENQASDNIFNMPRIWRGADLPIFLSKTFNVKEQKVDPSSISAAVITNIDVGLIEITFFDTKGEKLPDQGTVMPGMLIGKKLNEVRDQIIEVTGKRPPDMTLSECVYAAVSCHVSPKQDMGGGGMAFRKKL